MRKIVFLLLITILIQSCGIAPATSTPQPTSTIFVTYTLINTPTSTFTPVPSASPTIVKIPTQDPNQPFPTFPSIPIFIGDGDVTATQSIITTSTPSKPGPGFAKLSFSPTHIYWGGCEGNQAVINAEVEDPENVAGVILFTRVKSATEEDSTPWNKGFIMLDNHDGTYTFIAVGSEIFGHNHYKKSFFSFQLVAVDNKGEEVGRTKVYENVISMSPCPCLTPITGCPVPTRKP